MGFFISTFHDLVINLIIMCFFLAKYVYLKFYTRFIR
jgi:hypothetical protein